VHRILVRLVIVLGAASPPLAAQASFLVGYAGTVGKGDWQIEALEAGLATQMGWGPLRSGAATVRLGWFADQAVFFRGTRGFIGAFAVALRSAPLSLARIGDELNPTIIGLDLSLEAAGYLAARSPIPEGTRWGSLAALPALRVGTAEGAQFMIMLGPAFFAGRTQQTHAFLAARGEFPLARRRGGP